MKDHKLQASGDENFEYEPEKEQAKPEVLQEVVLKPGIKNCDRCNGEKEFFKSCKFCAFFDEVECECGCKFGKHKIWVFKEKEKSFCQSCFGWHGSSDGWGRDNERPFIHQLKAKRVNFMWEGLGWPK